MHSLIESYANHISEIQDGLYDYRKRQEKFLAMKSLRKKFMQRVYPEGTKVLHRFKDCGVGSVLWANDEHIAVHFENGDEYAYRPESIKRLEYPIR